MCRVFQFLSDTRLIKYTFTVTSSRSTFYRVCSLFTDCQAAQIQDIFTLLEGLFHTWEFWYVWRSCSLSEYFRPTNQRSFELDQRRLSASTVRQSDSFSDFTHFISFTSIFSVFPSLFCCSVSLFSFVSPFVILISFSFFFLLQAHIIFKIPAGFLFLSPRHSLQFPLVIVISSLMDSDWTKVKTAPLPAWLQTCWMSIDLRGLKTLHTASQQGLFSRMKNEQRKHLKLLKWRDV